MKTLVEMRRERIRAGKDDWEFDYIDTSEIMNSRIEEFDSRFTEPEEELEEEPTDDLDFYRNEKFEEFRKTKSVFYIHPAELPVFTGASAEDEEWYQRGFGGEIYLGESEAEAFEKFDEHMDEKESAFLGLIKEYAGT